MPPRRSGLGKGLEALIPSAPGAAEAAVAGTGEIPVDAIRPNPHQPRVKLRDQDLVELAASIEAHGVIQPIIVTREGDGYELIAGERRWRAARMAGLTSLPAIIKDAAPQEMLELALVENLQREDLNAVEETEAVLQLLELSLELDRGGALALLNEAVQEGRGRAPQARFSADQKRVAMDLFERLGRFTPASFLANRVPILGFPDELLEAVRQGRLDFTKAQALARLDDPADRRRLLDEAARERLSLSQIRRRITEARADRKVDRRLDDEVLDRLHAARRLLQRRSLVRLPDERLMRVGTLLDELLELLAEP